MINNKEKVVRCGKCDKYFVHTKENPKCPFCHTDYDKVEEKPKEKTKEKKVVVKSQKDSFKIWKDR